MGEILEQPRRVPVIDEVDLCVLGGSCTGVFAAIAAARRGLRVALVERMNCFGGVATTGMVCVWHSLLDTEHRAPIIAGLTQEAVDRLAARDAVVIHQPNDNRGFTMNTEELKLVLDGMVLEAGVRPHLHTWVAAPHVEDGRLVAAVVENKSGRGAIRATTFIDATGDGDLCVRLGLPARVPAHPQPPTTCVHFHGIADEATRQISTLVAQHGPARGLPEGFGWGHPRYDVPPLFFYAGSRVFGVNCADAADLTRAELEGRRQVSAIRDILREAGRDVRIAALPAVIGIRETRHITCAYTLTEEDVLTGRRFDDAIANGSYRVDIHHDDKPGLTFRYLDGTERYVRPGQPAVEGRWRPEQAVNPTFYQIPYRCLLPDGPYDNLLVAGRHIDADQGAFGAVRVMVNTNQMGEAAGVAAAVAAQANTPVAWVAPDVLRRELAAGGALVR